jgi:hypothetical protein
MPYPNEHSARLKSPGQYTRVRRENNKLGAGIHAIWGVKADNSVEIQAIRFDKSKFSVFGAKNWLNKHDYRPIAFEPASGETMEYLIPISLQEIQENGQWHVLLYSGKFNHPLYGEFNITRANLETAVRNFVAGYGTIKDDSGKKVIPLNYNPNHYDRSPDNAINSGFIKQLKLTDNRLEVFIDWTEKARKYIKRKEYRWLSAEFREDWKDESGTDRGFTVIGAALTNRPFLKNQLAIAVNDQGGGYWLEMFTEEAEEPIMSEEIEKLREILALDEGTDIAETVKNLTEKNADLEKKLQDSQKKLTDLEKDQKDKMFLDKEAYDKLAQDAELGKKASVDLQEMKINGLIDKALNEGRLIPAQVEEFKKVALADFELAEKLLEKTPKQVRKPEGTEGGRDGKTGSGDPGQRVLAEARKLMATEKQLSEADAIVRVLENDPELAEQYNNVKNW